MPVILSSGNIFDAGTEALCCTVNCVGVMGRGIALEFKHQYPEMFKEYARLCKRGFIQVGKVWIWWNPEPGNPRHIINFPTKQHWKSPSKLEWISAGLDDLKNRVIMLEIESIALPALGCANGGLCFEDVRVLVEEKLNALEIPVILYEPQ